MHTELKREYTSRVLKHTRLEALPREFIGILNDKRYGIVKKGYKTILEIDNTVLTTQELSANELIIAIIF